jgi:hypothetical protein
MDGCSKHHPLKIDATTRSVHPETTSPADILQPFAQQKNRNNPFTMKVTLSDFNKLSTGRMPL